MRYVSITFLSPLPLPLPSLRTRPYPSPLCRCLPHAHLHSHHPAPLRQGSTLAPPGLPNARDLATASPLVRSGRLFRGATPTTLLKTQTPACTDAIAFLHTASTLLDLRSRDERRDDEITSDAMRTLCGPGFSKRERHVGLLNKRKVLWGLTRVLPGSQVVELAGRVARNPVRARRGVVDCMDAGGLILLNRILVEASGGQIGKAMKTVTDGLRRQDGRVYFYCSAGKDRTGLLAALIFKVLGVGDDDIIRDYVRSEDTWKSGPSALRDDYIRRLVETGLTPVNWLPSPPEVMEDTLRYINTRYGSAEDYVIQCGFDQTSMDVLRSCMRM